MKNSHRKAWQVFFAVLLLTDGVAGQVWRHQPRAARSIQKFEFTETQKASLTNEVSCQFMGKYDEASNQVAKMKLLMNAMDEYDQLMSLEDEKLDGLQDSYTAHQILHEEQNQQCQANFTAMHTSCNTCIMEKCQDYYRNNCASLEPDPMEIIEPPCKTRSDSPCEEPERTDQSTGTNINRPAPRPVQNKVSSGVSIQITVNGESVPSMTDAMEMIKTTMTQKVSQPEADCEPGSQFAEFKEVVSPVRDSSSSYQVSVSSSGGNGDTGAAMGSMGSLTDMIQNENAKVQFSANINGKEIECDSYECIKQHQATLDQMARFKDLWNQRSSSFGQAEQQRGDSSGNSRFSYSMSGNSGSGPRVSSSSFRMSSSNKGGSFPRAESLGSSMTGGCSECGGCGQQQHASAAFRPSSVANSGPCGFQERSEIGHGRDLFGEVRRDLATLESDGTSRYNEDGNKFSYSWQGTGDIPENLEEILNLGLSGLSRQRSQMRSSCNSGRCTRNLREGLARSRRYYPTKTRRAVSQCAIEQAAKEAAERARQEEARRLSELAQRGGYNSACSMLNSQHGEAQTNMMVTELLTNLKSELGRATERCMAKGNCHNTRVNINIVGRTGGSSGCNPGDSNSPCSQEQTLYQQSRNKINEWTQGFNISINGSGSQPRPDPTYAPTRAPVYPVTEEPQRPSPQRTTPFRNEPVQPGSDSSSSPVDNSPDDFYAYSDSDYASTDDVASSELSEEYSGVSGDLSETIVQNPAEWAIWGLWSSCDINCANGSEKGSQVRRRNCEVDRQQVSIPRENCNVGDDVQYRECLPVPKPCNTWAHWGFWTECSATCGAGTRERTRSCMYGGECEGQKTQVEACTNLIHPDCPTWSDWQIAAECSVTCGQGVRSYFRTCQNGRINEPGCIGPAARQEPCETGRECALWTQWCEWSGCSTTCGQGDQVRERQCVNGEPGEPGCEGRANERKICYAEQRACPEWTPWSSFTACSVSCGEGLRTRVRDCRNGNIGDDGCIGEPEDTVKCQASRQCPFWSIWGSFNSCSVTCGEGERIRVRECVHGREGEVGCEGSSVDMNMCYGARRECEYWSEWSDYGQCSVTCDRGTVTRTRECINGRPGDAGCPGSDFEAMACEEEACIRYVEYDDEAQFPIECDENPDFGERDNQEQLERIEIEHREDEPFVMPPAPQTKDSTPPQDITCGGILEQDSQQCSSLFQESCISCDSSLSSVCAEYYSMKVQMEQLHHEMKQCEARKKFYAERKAELNIQYMELQQNVNDNHQWALNMAVSLIPAGNSSPAEYPPCDIKSATVQPEPRQFGFTISVVAKMNVTPWSEIRIDMDFNQPFSSCCSSRQTMGRTRRALGNRLMLKLRQISERNTPMSYP